MLSTTNQTIIYINGKSDALNGAKLLISNRSVFTPGPITITAMGSIHPFPPPQPQPNGVNG